MSILKSRKPVIILAIIFILYFVYNYIANIYYMQDHNYTVGMIFNDYYANTAYYYEYKYKVNGKWYENKGSSDSKKKIHSFFKVKYSIKKPSIAKIIFEQRIKDTVMLEKSGFKLK